MSGGSFNYLCFKSAEDLFGDQEELEHMVDVLATLGYAQDAAEASARLLNEVRKAEVRINTLLEDLSPVWRAVEWWHSGDTSEDGFKRALDKWRGV